MKKMIQSLICAVLMLTVFPFQPIHASDEEDHLANPTETAEINQPSEFTAKVVNSVEKDGVYYVNSVVFDLLLEFPESGKISDYWVDISSGDAAFRGCGREIASENDIDNTGLITGLRFDNEGQATLTITVKDNGENIYETQIKVLSEFGDLMVSCSELNLSTDNIVYYDDYDIPFPFDSVGNIEIGFLHEDNKLYLPSDATIESSDPSVVMVGNLYLWEELLENFSNWPHYEEFKPFVYQKAKELNSKYTTFREMGDILSEFCNLTGAEGGGWGATVLHGHGIVARNPGTAYITIKLNDKSTTIKVNVSNLSKDPVDSLPSGLGKEFYLDSNEEVLLNLTKPSKIEKDVFESAKATGKKAVFNIVDNNSDLLYSWIFDGKQINNADLSVDLKITKGSDNEKEIENLIHQSDFTVLNFAHHGLLPSPTKVKINVKDNYKDGQKLYLNYYDKNSSNPITEIEQELIVKDGFVEFTIEHCSTYILTTEKVKIETKDNINDKNENINDGIINTKTPNTGVEDNTGLYTILLLCSVVLGGMLVSKRNFV